MSLSDYNTAIDKATEVCKRVADFAEQRALQNENPEAKQAASNKSESAHECSLRVASLKRPESPPAQDVVERAAIAIAWTKLSPKGQRECVWEESFSQRERELFRLEARAALASAGLLPVQDGGWRTPTVEQTIEFIKKAHAGQTDKAGEEYWKHPVSVMGRIPNATDHEKIVALLHDVLEDSEFKPVDLLRMGYSFDVVWDVNTVTKHGNPPYQLWIQTIASLGSPTAIRVKIADLEDNLDASRLDNIPMVDRARLTLKYRTAWLTLNECCVPAPPVQGGE